jgi:hypothetical protein
MFIKPTTIRGNVIKLFLVFFTGRVEKLTRAFVCCEFNCGWSNVWLERQEPTLSYPAHSRRFPHYTQIIEKSKNTFRRQTI